MEPHVLSGFRKIMKKNKYMVTCLCMIAAALLLTGCGHSGSNQEEAKKEEAVKIPVIFTVSPQNGNKSNQELVDAFNKKYQGEYEIEVDWIMETEEEYRKNLKRQNVTDTMPAVITDLRLLPSFYQMIIEDKRVMDLSEYVESDTEWKEMIEPSVFECFEEEDGSMYLAPVSTAIFSCSGMFWNEELLQKLEFMSSRRPGMNSGYAVTGWKLAG